ncbi:hypothetical protein PTRA_a2160 [Pseudoalteromonas translucida KMM 520]|uniref:Uncharacterized protein n=1 Tax=Pseudoalteromonas translucida KMM 520 TaxID=1315283 RepID=A0A0U2V5U7_9GAMM|nr:WYL domain-containing protein [Pseudoalteromonas translucida]ALS33277.1 hypothetical protein PTRA_a2160 [Pseudoalteromonas translucida KMM 520]
MNLNNIGFTQKQRLSYIDFKLFFVGYVTRAEIVSYFEKGLTSATRDINLYKELCPENMVYDSKEKRYFQAAGFRPLFTHDPRKTLVKLSNQITDGFDAIGDTTFPVEAPSQLNIPDIFIVAKLVQAVINQKAVNITYTSLSSGSGERDIVPHSIVDNGLRWHVRAYDRKSNSFRDFVLTRITKAVLEYSEIQPLEVKISDHHWMRMMPLQLVPHPHNVSHPTAIALDYGMDGGKLSLNVRAAMAGYLLRRWNVDCTADAELVGAEYQLWLKNRQTLFGAENLAIAPGYVPELEEL